MLHDVSDGRTLEPHGRVVPAEPVAARVFADWSMNSAAERMPVMSDRGPGAHGLAASMGSKLPMAT